MPRTASTGYRSSASTSTVRSGPSRKRRRVSFRPKRSVRKFIRRQRKRAYYNRKPTGQQSSSRMTRIPRKILVPYPKRTSDAPLLHQHHATLVMSPGYNRQAVAHFDFGRSDDLFTIVNTFTPMDLNKNFGMWTHTFMQFMMKNQANVNATVSVYYYKCIRSTNVTPTDAWKAGLNDLTTQVGVEERPGLPPTTSTLFNRHFKIYKCRKFKVASGDQVRFAVVRAKDKAVSESYVRTSDTDPTKNSPMYQSGYSFGVMITVFGDLVNGVNAEASRVVTGAGKMLVWVEGHRTFRTTESNNLEWENTALTDLPQLTTAGANMNMENDSVDVVATA